MQRFRGDFGLGAESRWHGPVTRVVVEEEPPLPRDSPTETRSAPERKLVVVPSARLAARP